MYLHLALVGHFIIQSPVMIWSQGTWQSLEQICVSPFLSRLLSVTCWLFCLYLLLEPVIGVNCTFSEADGYIHSNVTGREVCLHMPY